jgi:hypothetical protein
VGPMEAIMSGVMTIFYYVMVIAVVWKLFQVATDLGEIKSLLIEMRRTTPAIKPIETTPTPPPILAGPISLESAEALLRQVEAESQALAAAEHRKTTA